MKFQIGFEREETKNLLEIWEKILKGNQWTEGYYTDAFEDQWAEYNGLQAVAMSSWAGAAYSALEYFNVKGKVVLCPSNTFMATPLITKKAGAEVQFVDCNRDDLCLSLDDLKVKVEKYNPAAVWIVHIGGHVAFEIKAIAKFCKEKNIILLEDCAHAHGASWNGKVAGTWGDTGVYSFYATKTLTTGEGGMLVSENKDLLEFSKKFRNYGKFDYDIEGQRKSFNKKQLELQNKLS